MQVKAKTINEIHSEAEKNMGLRPGATASMRNSRGIASSGQGSLSPGNHPGFGGMMPGMPGTRKMPGLRGTNNDDNWVVPRSRSMPRGVQPPLIGKPPSLNSKFLPQPSGSIVGGSTSALLQGSGGAPAPATARPALTAAGPPAPAQPTPTATTSPAPEKTMANPEELRRKTVSLLEEYFSVLMLNEALQCVEELNSLAYHPEVVKEAIALGLEKSPPRVEPVANLLQHLFSKQVLTGQDIGTGCLLYGSMLDDIAIDLPKAPDTFGEILGKLVLASGMDFKVVKEVLKKVEDDFFRKAIFAAVKRIVASSPSERRVLNTHAPDIEACESLL